MRHIIVGIRGERQISIAYIEDTQNVLCRFFLCFAGFFFRLHSVFRSNANLKLYEALCK